MSEKQNENQRVKYVEFRFEESLRKYEYEQQPNKRVKLHPFLMTNVKLGQQKNMMDERVMRLCQTRKIYLANSREKANEYLRKKEASQSSLKRSRLSNLSSSRLHSFEVKENEEQKKMQDEINSVPSVSKFLQENEGINCEMASPEIIDKQPLISSFHKEINNKVNKFSSKSCSQKFDLIQIKAQDLSNLFTDKLQQNSIQSANKLQNISIDNTYIQCPFFRQINATKKQKEQSMAKSVKQQAKNQKKATAVEEQSSIIKQVTQYMEQNQQNLYCRNHRIHSYRQMDYQQDSSQGDRQLYSFGINHKDTQLQNYNESIDNSTQNNDKISKQEPSGRIKFRAEKGECFLSARVFFKLCVSQKQPNKIVRTVVKHHPELQISAQQLQMLAKKNNN